MNQTYKNLEIILVDDGSPDNCPKICDEWAKKDSRIHVIHKQNGGLLSARNAGLDVAHGELIGFVDSDDYILPEMYEKLYNVIKNFNVDISICGYTFLYNDGTRKERPHFPYEFVIFKQEEALKNVRTYITTWTKLYKAHIFKNFRWPDNFRVSEDEVVVHRIIALANKVAVIDDCLYVYRLERYGSIVNNKKIVNKHNWFAANTYAFKDRCELAESLNYQSVVNKSCVWFDSWLRNKLANGYYFEAVKELNIAIYELSKKLWQSKRLKAKLGLVRLFVYVLGAVTGIFTVKKWLCNLFKI